MEKIMEINIQSIKIQINKINFYKLSAFPEDRINNLISELNIHYAKINSYIEIEVGGEKLDIEVADALVKLEEILRLSPHGGNLHGGDFGLGISLLDSVIAVLQTKAGHGNTRTKLLDLGWSLIGKLYPYSINKIIDESLLYLWLKSKGFASENKANFRRGHTPSKDEKLIFIPSEDDIQSFYQKNSQMIYEYMVYEMDGRRKPVNPFSDLQVRNFYHHHQTLSNINC